MIECKFCHEEFDKQDIQMTWCMKCSKVHFVCVVCCDEMEIEDLPEDIQIDFVANKEELA